MNPPIPGGIPPISGHQDVTRSAKDQKKSWYATRSHLDLSQVQSAFGIALHMHQPTIPASTDDWGQAGLISNLQYMMEHQDIGDNHNAPVFLQCYARIADIIKELIGQGKHPRVMLDYSGNLFWGLAQMGEGWALDNLKAMTADPKTGPCVEWLGTMWSHAVASSTPVPDLKLHMLAWRHQFAAIFGDEALKRVKGFSPPEMHLPIHPDVCYEYVKALKECGYEWLMVQEHTVENLDGSGIQRPHLPHKLVARNSLGETLEIIALIKTQGSDTKLVAQMQPYHEAKTLGHQDYCGQQVPPFVCQIGDGENGGVMMNEFPPGYKLAFGEITAQGTVAMNGSEYLEFLQEKGVNPSDFIPIQPMRQHFIWQKVTENGPKACDKALEQLDQEGHGLDLDKGSWTNDRSWVDGYGDVMDPMNALSVAFHQKFDGKNIDPADPVYQESLLYLMLSQTSCFRYWGDGLWIDFAKEICRRGMEKLS